VERFRSIARRGDVGDIEREADIVVNATSLGLRGGDPLPIDPARLSKPGASVLDLVYAPDATPLVRAARAVGRDATDGLSMLVGQGAAAFQWWFGVEPDRNVMWRALARPR
jgi:shikimate dehydrogenase